MVINSRSYSLVKGDRKYADGKVTEIKISAIIFVTVSRHEQCCGASTLEKNHDLDVCYLFVPVKRN